MLLGSVALAVKPEKWTHEQPKDFTAGKLDNVVVTSLGEVMLGRDTKTLFDPEDKAEVINALAQAGDGLIYAATGPNGIIYKIDGEKVTEFATLPPEGGTVFSLLFAADGRLLAGTGGGEQARIYRIDGTGRATVFYEPKDARYVWAMARGADGRVYAATGIEGQLHAIEADGSEGKVLVDLKPKNLLCLAIGSDGMLYTGTDGDGLVYRIESKTSKPFVLYDAKEPEISSIVLDAGGNVYASTASASAARPGRAIADKPGGRPEQPTTRPSQSDTSAKGDDEKAADEAKKANGGSPATREASSLLALAGKSLGKPVTPSAPKEGNAIYRIDRDGFVTQVFREPVMILGMAESSGTIYVATGNEGRVYAVTPAEDRTTMLTKLEPQQATTVLHLNDKTVIVGTANAAQLVRIADRCAAKGTVTSPVLDAGQLVKWGRMLWDAKIPEGAKLSIATRSSNVKDDESEAWEAWSGELNATSPQQIASATARFLQYRLTFETTVDDAGPTLRKIELTRIQENRAPKVESLQVASVRQVAQQPGAPSKVKAMLGTLGRSAPGPDYFWVIRWKASDPNKDKLVSDVFYREAGTKRWVRMKKDVTESMLPWDTRTVSDGEYEVRVLAKDVKANAPGTDLSDARISEPIIVDNTPPQVKIDEAAAKGKDAVRLRATFTDARSAIAGASYSVDSDEKWTPLAAEDDIFDAPAESVVFTIDDLEPGEHRIALRVRDGQGNTRYVSRSVTVGN